MTERTHILSELSDSQIGLDTTERGVTGSYISLGKRIQSLHMYICSTPVLIVSIGQRGKGLPVCPSALNRHWFPAQPAPHTPNTEKSSVEPGGASDSIYIPSKFFEVAANVLNVAADAKLFLELAIPLLAQIGIAVGVGGVQWEVRVSFYDY
jgi:hypothetical protein